MLRTMPFIQLELADPRVHTVFTSFDVIGSRHTLIVAYASERWWKESPRLYRATFAALSEAMDIIHKEPRSVAELFLRREPSKLSLEPILNIISDERMLYCTPEPTGIMAYADYMSRTGQLKNKLSSWKDAFFDNVHGLPGN
jgi:NitT/TauT family transport system substrate-binding protein